MYKFLFFTTIVCAMAADQGERWGYDKISQTFLELNGNRAIGIKADAVTNFQNLTQSQKARLMSDLSSATGANGMPIHPNVKTYYDQLHALFSQVSAHHSARDEGERWNYDSFRKQFLSGQGDSKIVSRDAEVKFKDLSPRRQNLLIAYLKLKLAGMGKPLHPNLPPLFKEFLQRTEPLVRGIQNNQGSSRLDPRRPGSDYTAYEFGKASAILQGPGDCQADFLAKLETYFSADRSRKILEDIANGDDNSIPEADPQDIQESQSDRLNGSLNDQGSGYLEFKDLQGKTVRINIPEISTRTDAGEKDNAISLRRSMIQLQNDPSFKVSKTEIVIPNRNNQAQQPQARSPRKTGEILVINSIVQDLVTTLDPTLKIGIHNFANAKQLGGGALNGRRAQEESIARFMPEVMLSYMMLPGERGTDVILTPGSVAVTQGHGRKSNITVYALAAPFLDKKQDSSHVKLNSTDNDVYGRNSLAFEDYYEIIKFGIINMLSLARRDSIDIFVTGAFGSGIYNNDPALIAGIFKEILNSDDGTGKMWKENFQKVIFSIPPGANLSAYQREFS